MAKISSTLRGFHRPPISKALLLRALTDPKMASVETFTNLEWQTLTPPEIMRFHSWCQNVWVEALRHSQRGWMPTEDWFTALKVAIIKELSDAT